MEDGYSYDGSVGDEDYEEEEVWASVKERRDKSPEARRSKDVYCSSSNPRRLPSASRVTPRSNAHGEVHGRALMQSAPINIPDWSKIYGHKGSSEGPSFRSSGRWADGDGEGEARIAGNDEDDDEDESNVPPHEWITRKLARSQISSSSMCEGAGRTLKGRDLTKVRNAVLTKTGFLE